MIIKTIPVALLGGLLMLSTQVYGAKVGLGIGRAAEFFGSDEFEFFPTVSFEYETQLGTFKNNQIGAQLDLLKNPAIDTGPILRANLGRDEDDVTDDVIAALPAIDASPEAGWFIGSGVRLRSLGVNSDAIIIGDIEAVTDVGDGHGGIYAKATVGIVLPVSEKTRFVPSYTVNYADDNYANAFYGVDANNASAELGAFEAEAGVESTQVALVGIHEFRENWTATGILALNTLQGDAADSPITERGSDTNTFTGFVIGYEF